MAGTSHIMGCCPEPGEDCMHCSARTPLFFTAKLTSDITDCDSSLPLGLLNQEVHLTQQANPCCYIGDNGDYRYEFVITAAASQVLIWDTDNLNWRFFAGAGRVVDCPDLDVTWNNDFVVGECEDMLYAYINCIANGYTWLQKGYGGTIHIWPD